MTTKQPESELIKDWCLDADGFNHYNEVVKFIRENTLSQVKKMIKRMNTKTILEGAVFVEYIKKSDLLTQLKALEGEG